MELQAPVGATLAPGTALGATAKGAAAAVARVVTAEVEVQLMRLFTTWFIKDSILN